MNPDGMMIAHQSRAPWEWHLGPATAVRLAASGLPRWLEVADGRVWLTQSGAGPDADDVWLEAGEWHALPAGTEWVAEGWPAARVALLEPARPARPTRHHAGGPAWRRLCRALLSAWPRSGPPGRACADGGGAACGRG